MWIELREKLATGNISEPTYIFFQFQWLEGLQARQDDKLNQNLQKI